MTKIPASLQTGITDDRTPLSQIENPRIATGLETRAGIAVQGRISDRQRTAAIIADKENRAATFLSAVVADFRTAQIQIERVAIAVNCPAAATARCAVACGIGAITDGAVVREQAVDYAERHANAG